MKNRSNSRSLSPPSPRTEGATLNLVNQRETQKEGLTKQKSEPQLEQANSEPSDCNLSKSNILKLADDTLTFIDQQLNQSIQKRQRSERKLKRKMPKAPKSKKGKHKESIHVSQASGGY